MKANLSDGVNLMSAANIREILLIRYWGICTIKRDTFHVNLAKRFVVAGAAHAQLEHPCYVHRNLAAVIFVNAYSKHASLVSSQNCPSIFN